MSLRDLEFAQTREGKVLVGYNPHSEEGGWVSLGDVTAAVRKIERERDDALSLLADAKRIIASIRISTAALASLTEASE